MSKLTALLGLKDDADEAAILKAVTAAIDERDGAIESLTGEIKDLKATKGPKVDAEFEAAVRERMKGGIPRETAIEAENFQRDNDKLNEKNKKKA